MNKQAKEKLIGGRTRLLIRHYFWGRLSLYLKLVERPEIPTLAVDGKHIFYNPEFILSLSEELLKSAIAHEVSHCVFDHFARRGGRDPKVWNYAGDYAINLILKDSGFVISPNWLCDRKYAGMSAEHIYDLLQNDSKSSTLAGSPLCEIMDAPPNSEGQTDSADISAEWKIAVVQAAHEAKKNGPLPGSMQRFIDNLASPKVPWREVLQRFITQVSKDDYLWTRPNRRFVAAGLYTPSLYSERMGPIVVAIDTSGSIDGPTLSAFGAEVKAIASQARPEKITVIYCDSRVNHVDEFSPDDELHFDMHGGGGTDFRPPFNHIMKSGETPAAFVYLTDMYGPFPEEADFPVLWCATTDIQGPFGETVRLEI